MCATVTGKQPGGPSEGQVSTRSWKKFKSFLLFIMNTFGHVVSEKYKAVCYQHGYGKKY